MVLKFTEKFARDPDIINVHMNKIISWNVIYIAKCNKVNKPFYNLC